MAIDHSIVAWPFGYATPNTPDLGCLVRNKHGFEVDYDFFMWAEPPPYDANFHYIPHQAYFHVKCGRAAHFQRCNVWMRPTNDALEVLASPPDYVLGGDSQPYPSDWLKFPPQQGEMYYWFGGEHRDPTAPDWEWDTSVGHSFDIYEHGTMSTVGFDDTSEDRDMNDLTLEVAIVYRQDYFGLLTQAIRREAELQRFVKEQLPTYRTLDQDRRGPALIE
jgi:hypothetical protein